MEKIQAAIAKARAARDAQSPQILTTPRVAHPKLSAASDTSVSEAWQRLPTFAPQAAILKSYRIVTAGAAEEGTAQFDMLRTRVLQQMRANGWRRLAITSPSSQCGKSTVVLNLAFSLARQTDLRIIVAEMDLRRPFLARALGLKGNRSFANVLQGEADFADQAIRARPNVALGLNQMGVRNPAELLQSPSVGTVLADLEKRYDPAIMLFDTAPMLVNDDTMAFMGQVDCALLIAAAGSSTVRQIDICERDLASQTNVLGVVLNKCRYMEGNSYGYESYS